MAPALQIDVLKEVVDAVGGRCEVYMDGGVRQGTDVLKALALGAKAVFIGRPVVWGLAYSVSWFTSCMLHGVCVCVCVCVCVSACPTVLLSSSVCLG